jgi:hypothetical protein
MAGFGVWLLAATVGTALVGPLPASSAVAKTQVAEKTAKKHPRGKANKAPTPSPSPSPAAAAAPEPALPPPRALPTHYRAVAVLPLVGIDVGIDLLHEFEVALLNEVDEIKGLRSISPGDVLTDLQRVGLDAATCDGAVRCLARAGRYAGAHQVLETKVAALGGTLSISMRLIDTETAQEVSRVAEPVSDDTAARALELHAFAVQLLTPEIFVGVLRIQCPEAGAYAYLDDKLVGETPLREPLKNLRAGPHILRVTKSGFSDLHQFVDVAFNRTSTISVDLSTTTVSGFMVEAESQTGVGALLIRTTEPGFEVRIDSEPKGVTPLAGVITGVPAGKRRLSLRKEGVPPFVGEIEVKAGQRTDLTVQRDDKGAISVGVAFAALDAAAPGFEEIHAAPVVTANESSPLAPPAPWTSHWRVVTAVACGGAAVLSLGASTYFGMRVSSINADTKAQVSGLVHKSAGSYTCVDMGQEACDKRQRLVDSLAGQGRTAEAWHWATLLTGVGLAAAGGGLLAWELYGATSSTATITAVPLPGGGVLGFARSF